MGRSRTCNSSKLSLCRATFRIERCPVCRPCFTNLPPRHYVKAKEVGFEPTRLTYSFLCPFIDRLTQSRTCFCVIVANFTSVICDQLNYSGHECVKPLHHSSLYCLYIIRPFLTKINSYFYPPIPVRSDGVSPQSPSADGRGGVSSQLN